MLDLSAFDSGGKVVEFKANRHSGGNLPPYCFIRPNDARDGVVRWSTSSWAAR
jgi:hypothetical protein